MNTAQLSVRMVSNDMEETAVACAKNAGILTNLANIDNESNTKAQVMSGDSFIERVGPGKTITELGQFKSGDTTEPFRIQHPSNMDEFRRITESLRVLYRASADQKQYLVTGLKFLGIHENMEEINAEEDPIKKCEKAMEFMRVVSVTGEGVNDTDSLSQAQVGLAMGSGCSAAKDSAQMVLTENKFSSAIAGIQWGRNIFQNCTRFLQFQLTVNISLILCVFVGIFVFSEPPMTAQMLLWINLIMDAFAAIALGTEPPIPNIVKGDPRMQTGLLKQKQVLRQIIGVSVWNILVIVMTFLFAASASGLPDFSYF